VGHGAAAGALELMLSWCDIEAIGVMARQFQHLLWTLEQNQ